MFKKNNHFITVTLIIVWASTLTFFPSCSQKQEQAVGLKEKNDAIIKIGATLPLTGNLSVFGNWIKKGINLAVNERKELNVEVMYEDNMGETSKAVTTFHKLSSMNEVKAIITAQTQVAKALLPLANNKKLFTVFTFSDLPEGSKDFTINYHFPVLDEINVLANFAAEKLGKKGAILVINDEFGSLSAEIFKEVFKESGGEIVFEEQFSFSQKDFRSLLSKLKKVGPNFLFVIAYTDRYVAITKTLNEMNFEIPIVGPNVLTVYLSMVKDYLPTSYFISSTYGSKNSNDSEYLEFVEKFKKHYNEEPNSVNAEAYEATKILLNAFSKNKNNINRFFDSFKNYKGIFGKVIVDENRQAHFPLIVIKFSQRASEKEVVWEFHPDDSGQENTK